MIKVKQVPLLSPSSLPRVYSVSKVKGWPPYYFWFATDLFHEPILLGVDSVFMEGQLLRVHIMKGSFSTHSHVKVGNSIEVTKFLVQHLKKYFGDMGRGKSKNLVHDVLKQVSCRPYISKYSVDLDSILCYSESALIKLEESLEKVYL